MRALQESIADLTTGQRVVQVETPEHVVVGYELADLGSRFLALFLDTVILACCLGGMAAAAVSVRSAFDLPLPVGGWGVALLVLFLFGLPWSYFVYFEGLREGRTPGKKWAGIRVVHDGGHPLTLRGAAIRNLIRAVDAQPALTWLVGGTTMMLHPQTRRLGDLAAGTLVVRDRGDGTLPEDAWAPAAARGAPRLTAGQFQALDQFVGRRASLEGSARIRVAQDLGRALGDVLPQPSTPAKTLQDPQTSTPAKVLEDQQRSTAAKTLEDRLLALHADESARRSAAGAASVRGSRQAAALVHRQRKRWLEYEALLEAAQRDGLASLSEDDVSRFASLYRQTAADLARARTYGGSGELVYAIERWVGAGHNLLYRPGTRSWAKMRTWLVHGFPALVRLHWRAVALAGAALFLPAIVTYGVVRARPATARELLPAATIARAEQAPQRMAEGTGYVDAPDVFAPVMSSAIIANNVQVTFFAFAGGILAGLGTVLLLVVNGVHLGAVAALYDNQGAGALLWTFVAPHGVIELAAICIAGGAGLWMGSALLWPGRSSRTHVLAVRAREGISLVAGTTLLLVLAGAIEGFISPASLPTPAKLGIAAAVALACAFYLLRAGRHQQAQQEAHRVGEL